MSCKIVGGTRDLVPFQISPSEGITIRAQCKGEHMHHPIAGLIRYDTATIAACLGLDLDHATVGWLPCEKCHFRIGNFYFDEDVWDKVANAILLAILRHRIAIAGAHSDDATASAVIRWGDE
jgi:hypothetical protein